jgi:pilus assembly protein CpaF
MTQTDLPASQSGAPGEPDDPEQRLRTQLRQALTTDLPGRVEADTRTGGSLSLARRREVGREVLDTAIAAHSEAELLAGRALVDSVTEQRIVEQVLDEVFGLGGLQPLLADPSVETIAVNRFDRVFVQYNDGRRAQAAPVASSNEELTDLIRTLAARASSEERRFDRGSPALNLQLPGGERLFAVLGLTAGGVTACTIRRHGYLTATLAQLRRRGTLDVGLERFLRALVRARKNVLITGGTGAGKTTLLRGLASEMDPAERIVTVEDAFELGLGLDPGLHADVTALQAREPNVEGEGGIDQAELVRWGLRMSPDRVIAARSAAPRSSRCATP